MIHKSMKCLKWKHDHIHDIQMAMMTDKDFIQTKEDFMMEMLHWCISFFETEPYLRTKVLHGCLKQVLLLR